MKGDQEVYQFKETEAQKPVQKMSGFADITYLTSSPEKRGLEKEDPKKIEYTVAGVHMRISDIVKLGALP